MAKAKKGELFTCELCGLVVAVDEWGNSTVGELVCCDVPMEKGKAAAAKAKKAAKPAKKAKKPAKAKKVKGLRRRKQSPPRPRRPLSPRRKRSPRQRRRQKRSSVFQMTGKRNPAPQRSGVSFDSPA